MGDQMDVDHGDNLASLFAHLGSAISASAILGFLAGVVPTIGILMAIVWYSVMIWETKTIRNWIAHRQIRKARTTVRRASARIATLHQEEADANELLRHFKLESGNEESEQ